MLHGPARRSFVLLLALCVCTGRFLHLCRDGKDTVRCADTSDTSEPLKVGGRRVGAIACVAKAAFDDQQMFDSQRVRAVRHGHG